MSVFSEWENLGELIEYSAALEDEVQLQMLSRSLNDSDIHSARLDAWLRGDVDALTRLADATALRYPDAHRVVNVERSSGWVGRISMMLGDGDTEFVAVGIGHLVGSDNLLSQLRARGLEVERVN
jgi:uncharacterized protein YbaP (TraB family)